MLEAEYEDHPNDVEILATEEDVNLKLGDMIIVRRTGCFYTIFGLIQSIMCILSSYWYSWISCFGNHYDPHTFWISTLIFETFFAVAMIVEFITDYTDEGNEAPTRDFHKIAKRYLKDGFVLDFIPLFPLQSILDAGNFRIKIFYLPKCLRFISGFKIFDIKAVNRTIKAWQHSWVMTQIKHDPLVAED